MKRIKKRKKKNSRCACQKYTLTNKQLKQIKADVTSEAVTKTGMLYLVALAEKGWGEDDIVDLFETISRYTKYIDDKVVKIKEIQAMIERKTGITIKGKW